MLVASLTSLRSFVYKLLARPKLQGLFVRSCMSQKVRREVNLMIISKYGNPHRQIRALVILDGLIDNAGTRFQKTFADEPLLERLRLMARDDMVDPDVKKKCNDLFNYWAKRYKNTQGLAGIATLYKQLPQKRRPQPSQSKVLRQNELEAQQADHDGADASPTHRRTPSHPPASSSRSNPVTVGPAAPLTLSGKKDKKSKGKPFNLEKEKGNIRDTIANASIASTNLLNALQLVNRETDRVSTNKDVVERFDVCKQLRRQILRYIQLVESEQWIGSLLTANDELVKALMAYEIMDKSIDDDSDSDTETAMAMARSRAMSNPRQVPSQEEAAPAKPPRPTSIPMPTPAFAAAGKQKAEESEPEVDEDDPFGDQNAVKTPYIEQGEMSWSVNPQNGRIGADQSRRDV